MKLKLFCTTLFAAVVSLAAPAHAKIDEWRLGYVNNLQDDHGDIVDGKEGENVELEIVSSSPDFLNLIGSPRPYALLSGNVSDDGVNFGGVGLLWRWEFADGWAFEPGFGYIIHDGEIDNPFPDGSPEAAQFQEDHVLLGSEDLFRTSLGLTYDPEGPWEGQLLFEHLSHGQILGNGRNQGLDNIGVRIGYRFGS